jgi:hypothetical protein
MRGKPGLRFAPSGLRGYEAVPTRLRGRTEPPSKAQREQRNNADPDHQHRERYRIVVEPIPTKYTHDAALPYRTHQNHSSFRALLAP